MVDSLPASVAEYVSEHREVTPDEVLRECEIDESWRPQVEHYLAITRYSLYKDNPENDADGLRWDRVEWDDVRHWKI
ncbi:hypothetical protein [Halococcus salsus]|uniref:hypothetical protein n=1 Tax=Halococcus salsus TaxID=2162894 RepID=UPI00135CF3C8|nr:hypothetical protein [Halococcus salsus]